MSDDGFDYEPPKVTWEPITKKVEREDDDGRIVVDQETVGHKVEPPWNNEEWDELTKLRWFAALIEYRTGVGVRVARDPDWSEGSYPSYNIALPHMESTTPAPYPVVWGWLSGFEAGIYEGRVSS
jgi:hypothetical protein